MFFSATRVLLPTLTLVSALDRQQPIFFAVALSFAVTLTFERILIFHFNLAVSVAEVLGLVIVSHWQGDTVLRDDTNDACGAKHLYLLFFAIEVELKLHRRFLANVG